MVSPPNPAINPKRVVAAEFLDLLTKTAPETNTINAIYQVKKSVRTSNCSF
jgi:hypothetical protein